MVILIAGAVQLTGPALDVPWLEPYRSNPEADSL